MALNKLKKWIGTQAMTAFFDQLNDNVDATNAAIDAVESHSAESVSDDVHGLAWTDYEELTLLNGWTGSLRVRKNAMDMVSIYGEITPGVTDRGTTIATLSSKYRPGRVSALPAQSASLNTGAISGLAVVASGNINIYGSASDDIGVNNVRINHIYVQTPPALV